MTVSIAVLIFVSVVPELTSTDQHAIFMAQCVAFENDIEYNQFIASARMQYRITEYQIENVVLIEGTQHWQGCRK